MKANPDTQDYFGSHPGTAIMGDYPTMSDIDNAYGYKFSAQWLVPQLYDLSMHVGAKNLTEYQQARLAEIIAAEYRHYKITEILLFFHRFKVGRYGRFYGTVDPMVITCALREFADERNNMIDAFEQQERERKAAEEMARPTITWEEWKRMKEKIGEKVNNKTNPLNYGK